MTVNRGARIMQRRSVAGPVLAILQTRMSCWSASRAGEIYRLGFLERGAASAIERGSVYGDCRSLLSRRCSRANGESECVLRR